MLIGLVLFHNLLLGFKHKFGLVLFATFLAPEDIAEQFSEVVEFVLICETDTVSLGIVEVV